MPTTWVKGLFTRRMIELWYMRFFYIVFNFCFQFFIDSFPISGSGHLNDREIIQDVQSFARCTFLCRSPQSTKNFTHRWSTLCILQTGKLDDQLFLMHILSVLEQRFRTHVLFILGEVTDEICMWIMISLCAGKNSGNTLRVLQFQTRVTFV